MGRKMGIDGLDDLDLVLNIDERIEQAIDEEAFMDGDLDPEDEDWDEDADFDWGEE